MTFEEAYRIARGLGCGPIVSPESIPNLDNIRALAHDPMVYNYSHWPPMLSQRGNEWSMLIKAPKTRMTFINKVRILKNVYLSIQCSRNYGYSLTVYCGDLFHPHRYNSGVMCLGASRSFPRLARADFAFAVSNALTAIATINPRSLVSVPVGLSYSCKRCARIARYDRFGFEVEKTERGWLCNSCAAHYRDLDWRRK